MRIPDELGIADGLDRYFEAAGMGRGYDERWVRLKLGPIPFVFPNSPARVRAARLHDLHHLATDYGTDLLGESEIGAWELASGCAHHWPAWTLNVAALVIGLFVAPRRVFAAFVRGRHTTNLYQLESEFHAGLLDGRVGALRERLGLTSAPVATTLADRLAFVGWLLVSVLYYLGGPITMAMFAWSLYPVGLPGGRSLATSADPDARRRRDPARCGQERPHVSPGAQAL
jgi:hypothetical protein